VLETGTYNISRRYRAKSL